MNRDALKRRFQESFCSLLASAARGFIALTGTSNYNEHEAVLDLLTLSPHLNLKEPIATTIAEFLTLYKTSNNLAFIPSPTVEHSFKDVLIGINGGTRAHKPNEDKDKNATSASNTIVIDDDSETAGKPPIAGLAPSPIEITKLTIAYRRAPNLGNLLSCRKLKGPHSQIRPI